MRAKFTVPVGILGVLASLFSQAQADENIFGYVRGAETLPKDSWEAYQIITHRFDKGFGTYKAYDSETELEYGITDRFSLLGSLKLQSVQSKGLLIDAYIPKDSNGRLQLSGAEIAGKYNFLSPAKDDFGLSAYLSLERGWSDPHSSQEKTTNSIDLLFSAQKYFLEGEVIWVANAGSESTYAKRYKVDNLPKEFEWPTHPEMEIGLTAGTGLSYRVFPSWFIGGETVYETEFETEVGEERWSLFAGPSLHFGGQSYWATLTWFPQLVGGASTFEEQDNKDLQLIEKTKQEIRAKLGFNF